MGKIKNSRDPKISDKTKMTITIMALGTLLACGVKTFEHFVPNNPITKFGSEIGISKNIKYPINAALEYFNNLEQTKKGHLIENANGEWKNYKYLVSVTYEIEGNEEFNIMEMGVEEENDNQRIYRSFRLPEFTLIEDRTEEENYEKYIFQCNGETNETTKSMNVTSVAWGMGVPETRSYEEVLESEKNSIIVEKLANVSETELTLKKYNNYLQQMGCNITLTEEDLELIESNSNDNTVSIKLGITEKVQAAEDNIIVESVDNNIELLADPFCTNDLFTNRERSDIEFTEISSLEEYIVENDIPMIGYTTPIEPGWGDNDKEFILTNYGEDVWFCLQQNGLPIPCYKVGDFYEAYAKSKVSQR